MKSIYLIAVASLALAGCKTTAERQAERQIADHAKCVSYGFKPETEGYASCLMRLDTARDEEAAAKRLIKKQRECMEASSRNPGGGFWGGFLSGVNKDMACK
jgi:hypothetical protein